MDNIKLPIIIMVIFSNMRILINLSNYLIDGVMIARGAIYNPSIFSYDGVRNINDIVEVY